jgi:hypothetical protein
MSRLFPCLAWSVTAFTALLLLVLEVCLELADRGGYPGVHAVAAAWVAAVAASGFEARAMARGLVAVAAIQAGLCLLVLPSFGSTIMAPAAVFCALWLLSAGLFCLAAAKA